MKFRYIALLLAASLLMALFACGEETDVKDRYWTLDPLNMYNEPPEAYDIHIVDGDAKDKFYFVNEKDEEELRFTLENVGCMFTDFIDGNIVIGHEIIYNKENAADQTSRVFFLNLETGECDFPKALSGASSYALTRQGDLLLLDYREDDLNKLAKYDMTTGELTVLEEMPVDVSSNISDLMMIGDTFFYRRSGRYMWRLAPDGSGGYSKEYISALGRNVEAMLLDGDSILAAAQYRVDLTEKNGLVFFRVYADGTAEQIGLLEDIEHFGLWYDLTLDGDTLVCTTSQCCSEEHHEYRVKIA